MFFNKQVYLGSGINTILENSTKTDLCVIQEKLNIFMDLVISLDEEGNSYEFYRGITAYFNESTSNTIDRLGFEPWKDINTNKQFLNFLSHESKANTIRGLAKEWMYYFKSKA